MCDTAQNMKPTPTEPVVLRAEISTELFSYRVARKLVCLTSICKKVFLLNMVFVPKPQLVPAIFVVFVVLLMVEASLPFSKPSLK